MKCEERKRGGEKKTLEGDAYQKGISEGKKTMGRGKEGMIQRENRKKKIERKTRKGMKGIRKKGKEMSVNDEKGKGVRKTDKQCM